ncbi:hypothetical protein [Acetobacter musti]|uniref:hypothetical protein n=1 Tax=Acetobacter musti TaxID=864732 RepID=UPI001F5512D9|nr:hypothetical protein [Acetobacter musti]
MDLLLSALTVVSDLIDTLIRVPAHYVLFSIEYWLHAPVCRILCGIAIVSADYQLHAGFVISGLL